MPQKPLPQNFSLIAFMKLTRFGNLIIIALAQYFVAIFLIHSPLGYAFFLWDIKLHLLALSTIIIAAAGYIINDYYDVKIDFINKPERVVVGKILKRRAVMIAHTVLNFIGVAIGLYLSIAIGSIHFLSALLLWWYSNRLKRLPFIGNFAVALLTGLSIYIVAFLYGQHNLLVFIYALYAGAFTLFREIVKDMEDLRGDETFGCKTLPIIWGFRKTKIFLYVLMVLFLVSTIFIGYQIKAQGKFFEYSLLMTLPIVFLIQRIYRADTVAHFAQLSRSIKWIMLAGILSMMLI